MQELEQLAYEGVQLLHEITGKLLADHKKATNRKVRVRKIDNKNRIYRASSRKQR